MLFVTNRVFTQGPETVVGRKVAFDLANTNAQQSIFFCERMETKERAEITEIGSKAFLGKLRRMNVDQILFYIHGFSNLPEKDIFPRTGQLSALCEAEGLSIAVVPVIWPCDNDLGMIKDYYDDQVAADASSTAFSRALSKFLEWSESHAADEVPCTKRINVLAHSMGNRVLRGALLDWSMALSGQTPYVFRNIFMVAADVVNETLAKDEDGVFICRSARNVVVYHASDDLALRSSKVANLRNSIASRRLGHTGPEDMSATPDNVYAIDCDDVNTVYDNPKGHSYFLDDRDGSQGAVFRHIAACMRTGRVPVDAPGGRTLTIDEAWKP